MLKLNPKEILKQLHSLKKENLDYLEPDQKCIQNNLLFFSTRIKILKKSITVCFLKH
jgi:hypothetical protein